jgi:hypothetical protein
MIGKLKSLVIRYPFRTIFISFGAGLAVGAVLAVIA